MSVQLWCYFFILFCISTWSFLLSAFLSNRRWYVCKKDFLINNFCRHNSILSYNITSIQKMNNKHTKCPPNFSAIFSPKTTTNSYLIIVINLWNEQQLWQEEQKEASPTRAWWLISYMGEGTCIPFYAIQCWQLWCFICNWSHDILVSSNSKS